MAILKPSSAKKCKKRPKKFKFKTPSSVIIGGASNSGKSFLINQILQYRKLLIDKPVHRVFVYYLTWQPLYDELKSMLPSVTFFDEINVDELPSSPPPGLVNVYLFDDQSSNLKYKSIGNYLLNFFVANSHHFNLLTFYVTQNIYQANAFQRTMSLNAQYLIAFKNLRDVNQIKRVAGQVYGFGNTKPFMQVYEKEMQFTNCRYVIINTNICEEFPRSCHVNVIPVRPSVEYEYLERAYIYNPVLPDSESKKSRK